MELSTKHHNGDRSVVLESGRTLRIPGAAFEAMKRVVAGPAGLANLYGAQFAEFFIGGNGEQQKVWLAEWHRLACYCGYAIQPSDETCPACGHVPHELRERGHFEPFVSALEYGELVCNLMPKYRRFFVGPGVRDGPFSKIEGMNIRTTRPFRLFRADIEGVNYVL